jgi:SAM-dependent methyltransferase
MPDQAHALALLAEEGWRTLVDAGLAFDEAGGDALRAATVLAKRRADAEPARRAAALELVSEGARLARKLGVTDRLVAVREAVEQATSGRVATWHAQQVPEGARVLEIGCGCGGDSLALAHRAKNLIACDVDPVRAACAHINLTTTGLATSRAIPGDGLELLDGEAADADVVFADPDRRAGGRRSLDPEAWRPPLSRLAALARTGRRVFVKAAPSLDADVVAGTFRVAYVSHAGECVEAFLESPCEGEAVRAVLLPGDGPSVTLTGDRGDAPSGRVGDMLYVPDPAAIRARLLAELCSRHALRLVAPGIAFLTGERGVASPWLAAYEVLNVANGSQHAAARCVAERHASDVRVHARGTRVPVEEIERILRAHVDPRGGGPVLDLFVSRADGGAVTIVARREDGR